MSGPAKVLQMSAAVTVNEETLGDLKRAYRRAGTPFGDTELGLERWLSQQVHTQTVAMIQGLVQSQATPSPRKTKQPFDSAAATG